MEYTRILRLGDSGEDVKYIKQCLYSLGYLTVAPTKLKFGSDTERAVKKFQKENYDKIGKKLDVDGKVGPLTWDSIITKLGSLNPLPEEDGNILLKPSDYPKIIAANLKLINDELKTTTSERYTLVKFVLGYARDADYISDLNPSALYIYGANLINTKLGPQLAGESGFLDSKARSNPQYFDGGRKEWMETMIKKFPQLVASDCSGMIVGALRLYKYVSTSFDQSANNFCSNSYSKAITKTKLQPGDWVGFSGHIGMYVGGGFVVEFAGGAYGCQLTRLSNRLLRNLMSGRVESGKAWTKFRLPKYYK